MLCFASLIGFSGAEASAPKIALQASEYDFGTIKQGEEVSHIFTFKNMGDADLIITDVKTSCGCTAAVTSAKTIAPGSEGTLEVTFNSKGRQGRQAKTATIFSNDPEKPSVAVRISGNINVGEQPQILIDPGTLDLGVLEPGETAARSITIRNSGTADLSIEDFVGRNYVTVKSDNQDVPKRVIKPNESFQIEVLATPANKAGIYQGYLQIRNNSARRIVTVPLYGYISDKYMLKPEFRK
jgi:hypothetical protein